MAGSDENEKAEKKDADKCNTSKQKSEKESSPKGKPPELQLKTEDLLFGLKKDSPNDPNNLNSAEQVIVQPIVQGLGDVHLVNNFMKVKTNPTVNHLAKFVGRLNKIVTTINNLEGVKVMYKFSDELSEKVKDNIKELEFLSLEMKATLMNLIRLRQRKALLRKEQKHIKETHSATKREELQEMETVVAIYDKELLRSWHVTKKSTSIQTIENFISHLKGKKQAMEYIYQLAIEKLTSLKKKLGKQPKGIQRPDIKALPPPSSGSDQDSIISTD